MDDSRFRFEAKRLAATLGIDPLYVVSNTDHFSQLSEAERRFIFSDENIIAFTNPVADLLFQDGSLRYEWEGRGCCVVFQKSPLGMNCDESLGTLIHEFGHYLNAFDNPARDEADPSKAVKLFWNGMTQSSEHHTKRWLRATVHLWHRVCKAGYEIPLDNVVCLEQYGFSREDLAPILDEAERREGEGIERILSCRTHRSPAAKRKRRSYPRSEMIAGQLVTMHGDGRVVTTADLYGNGGGKVFASVREFCNSLEPVA